LALIFPLRDVRDEEAGLRNMEQFYVEYWGWALKEVKIED
jgi:hypothetical protein